MNEMLTQLYDYMDTDWWEWDIGRDYAPCVVWGRHCMQWWAEFMRKRQDGEVDGS